MEQETESVACGSCGAAPGDLHAINCDFASEVVMSGTPLLLFACPTCGCTDVQATGWYEINSGKLCGDDGSGECFCPQCDMDGRDPHYKYSDQTTTAKPLVKPDGDGEPFKCRGCGRPELECSREPCADVIADREATTEIDEPEHARAEQDHDLDALAASYARELEIDEPDSEREGQNLYLRELDAAGATVLINSNQQCLACGGSDFARDGDAPLRCLHCSAHFPKEPFPHHGDLETEIEVSRVAVVSTAHLSPAELEALPNGKSKWTETFPLAAMGWEYGAQIYVADGAANLEVVGEPAGSWRGMIAAARWARVHGFDWIRFDADGPIMADLPRWG